jgi:tellurite resistance protein TerC
MLDINVVTIIVQLVFLEGILSIDNAAVLGAMVLHLPDDQPIPWPRWLNVFNRWSGRMGMQRDSALKVGLVGAYAGRALMLVLAGTIIHVQWVRILGAIYLLYLGIDHIGQIYRDQQAAKGGLHIAVVGNSFWVTVGTTILADLAFSIDNVIAAVALSDQLWVVLVGVAIGMVIMRFAAGLFSRAIAWEPTLETGAYLLLLAIGTELLLKEYFDVHIGEFTQFAISVSILALTVIVARLPLLRRVLIIFRPVMALFAAIQWSVEQIKNLLTMPFRRRSLPSNKA